MISAVKGSPLERTKHRTIAECLSRLDRFQRQATNSSSANTKWAPITFNLVRSTFGVCRFPSSHALSLSLSLSLSLLETSTHTS